MTQTFALNSAPSRHLSVNNFILRYKIEDMMGFWTNLKLKKVIIRYICNFYFTCYFQYWESELFVVVEELYEHHLEKSLFLSSNFWEAQLVYISCFFFDWWKAKNSKYFDLVEVLESPAIEKNKVQWKNISGGKFTKMLLASFSQKNTFFIEKYLFINKRHFLCELARKVANIHS